MINSAHPGLTDALVERIKRLCPDGEIGTFVILGDGIDYSQASTDNAESQFDLFMRKIEAAFTIQNLVYVIGNHDHHVLADLFGKKRVLAHVDRDPFGEKPLALPKNKPKGGKKIEEIFGGREVKPYYPNFEFHDPATGDYYLFTHGHLFSQTVLKVGRLIPLAVAPSKAKDLKELVDTAWTICELIWNEQRSKIPEYVYETFRGAEHEVFRMKGEKRIKRYLFDVLGLESKWSGAERPAAHFVFGHTHHAFNRFLDTSRGPVRLYNTGGWLAVSPTYHPHTMLFTITECGASSMENVFADVRYGPADWKRAHGHRG